MSFLDPGALTSPPRPPARKLTRVPRRRLNDWAVLEIGEPPINRALFGYPPAQLPLLGLCEFLQNSLHRLSIIEIPISSNELTSNFINYELEN